MNLYEYQAKRLLTKYDLPVLKGFVCSNLSDITDCIFEMQSPWVLKCQILAGGRGKSGGICITQSCDEAISFANKWFGNKLITKQTIESGEMVNSILIEPNIKIIKEFYLSITIERDLSQIVCIASNQGGVDIENVGKKNSELIHKIMIDPIYGIYPYQGRLLAYKLGIDNNQINKFVNIIINLVKVFLEKDLTLIEINPLVLTNNNNFVCVDSKIVIDDNSIFRQSDLLKLCFEDNVSKLNKEFNVNYVPLNGNIGCMVNGAGLAMATMDLIRSFGKNPANFLDIGGNANKEDIVLALNVILNDTRVKAIFINIFGGIVCCDLVADSIITALSDITTVTNMNNHVPIIVRLEGNNSTLGTNRLINSNFNITITNDLIDAIKYIVSVVK